MPPNKSNYSKRPVRRVRLPKIGLRKTKSLFEEYFYAFLVTISVVVTILGKAGGLSGYDAIVTGLWVGGFTWFAWQVSRYRKEQTGTGSTAKSGQAVQAAPQMTKKPLPSEHEAHDRAAMATENPAKTSDVRTKVPQASTGLNEARRNAGSGRPGPGDTKQSA